MVTPIYEKERLKRLTKHNLAIETLYYNPNQYKSDILVRSTDNKMNDEIISKSIQEKRYFLNDKLIFREKKFNPTFLYTIYSYNNDDEIIQCPNCGAKSKAIDLIDGCNYCGTNFNLGLNSNNIMKKIYIWKFSFGENFIEAFIKILLYITMPGMLIYILSLYDEAWFLGILALILSTVLYILLFNFVSKKFNYKRNVQAQEPVPKKSEIYYHSDIFYGDLYKEVMIDCFNNQEPNLIDIDILDYCDDYAFLKNDIEHIKIKVLIRKVYYDKNKKIKVNKYWYSLCFKANEIKKDNKNYEVVTCNGCGDSISYTDKKCLSCGRINDSKNNWILIESKMLKHKVC